LAVEVGVGKEVMSGTRAQLSDVPITPASDPEDSDKRHVEVTPHPVGSGDMKSPRAVRSLRSLLTASGPSIAATNHGGDGRKGTEKDPVD